MENLQLTAVSSANTGMLILKPVAEVFAAIVDPAITTNFEQKERLNPHWRSFRGRLRH